MVRSSRWQRGHASDPAAAALHHDDLRHHVRAGAGDGLGQSRSGLPRHRRARRSCARWRWRPSGKGATSTRRAAAYPSCASAVAGHQRAWYGIELDPELEVLVTVGATEAIAATMLALCEPGDEVVMFEPTYDSYAATTSMAGAMPRLVRLHPPDWHFDPGDLVAAVGPRTKMVLLNSPHNPTGKVFSARGTGPGRRAVYRPRPPGGDRRGLRASRLRRDARPPGHPPRHGVSAPSPSPRAARRSPSPAGRWAG